MNSYHIAILSIIQGLTEFIPVSSSAHLLLLSRWTGETYQGLLMDVGLHMGSLGATCFYFRRSLEKMIRGVWIFFCRRTLTEGGRQVLLLIVGTLPAVIGGYFVHKWNLRQPETLGIIGTMSLLLGALLWGVDTYAPSHREARSLTYFQAGIIGLGQLLALSVPGSSRLGCTLTLCRLLGLNRKESLTFSFLLSLPTVVAALVLLITTSPQGQVIRLLPSLSWAMVLTALVGILTLSLIFKWTQKHGFFLFCAYRMILGGILVFISTL